MGGPDSIGYAEHSPFWVSNGSCLHCKANLRVSSKAVDAHTVACLSSHASSSLMYHGFLLALPSAVSLFLVQLFAFVLSDINSQMGVPWSVGERAAVRQRRKKDMISNVSKCGRGQKRGEGGHCSKETVSADLEKAETDRKCKHRSR